MPVKWLSVYRTLKWQELMNPGVIGKKPNNQLLFLRDKKREEKTCFSSLC